MSDVKHNRLAGVYAPRVETDQLLNVEGLAEIILNMRDTPEGTLRTITGPAAISSSTSEVHGIGHAIIAGKELLVRQTTDRLQVWQGWDQTWKDLTAPGSNLSVPTVTSIPQFPPTFISTPAGMIILPKGDGARPLFYDGRTIAYLGFFETPGAPDLILTQTPTTASLTVATGVTPTGAKMGVVEGIESSLNLSSRRLRTTYSTVTQFLDKWGNLSPMSSRSPEVIISFSNILTGQDQDYGLARMRMSQVDTGGINVVGRILGCTRNSTTSGTTQLFEVPQHENPSGRVLATIPDNVTEIYILNVADSRLALPMKDIAPVPRSKVGAMAMGSLWLAAEDGGIWPSLPGRWGTFPRNGVLYPDPSGAEITGLLGVPGGLLAFTLTSTMFITPNDQGTGYKKVVLSSLYGCSAPASIQTLPSGVVIWLGRQGFLALTDGNVIELSLPQKRLWSKTNKGRLVQAVSIMVEGMYRCWVAQGTSQVPNICHEFNGTGWRRRIDTRARSVCVTRDYRAYTIVAGVDELLSREGVYILDREGELLGARSHTTVVETTWMMSEAVTRQSLRRIILIGRETGLGSVTVQIMRDWDETVVATHTILLHSEDAVPDTWDTAVLGIAKWTQRRPFYGTTDVDISSAESIKLRFSATSDLDFLGFVLQTQEQAKGGSWV